MKRSKHSTTSFRAILPVVISLTVAGFLTSNLCFAQTALRTTSAQTNAAPAAPSTAPAPLTGAELYSMNCNRCHAERYPTERTAANWKTINLHMQIRANIPPSQARLILKYLQDNSGR